VGVVRLAADCGGGEMELQAVEVMRRAADSAGGELLSKRGKLLLSVVSCNLQAVSAQCWHFLQLLYWPADHCCEGSRGQDRQGEGVKLAAWLQGPPSCRRPLQC
jgi:hypothetical protein